MTHITIPTRISHTVTTVTTVETVANVTTVTTVSQVGRKVGFDYLSIL